MMTNNAGTGQSLRTRKRAAAQSAIEGVAVSLALEHGYGNVTVEMICATGMISQRTFFNYFGSKEGVILGVAPPLPTEEQAERFIHGDGTHVLEDLVGIITAAVVECGSDSHLLKSRRMLIFRTPELLTKEKARMDELEDYLVRMVQARFRSHSRTDAATPDLDDEARMTVALALGAMRYAMQKWVGSNFTSTRQELLRNSSELIHRIIGSGQSS